MGGKKRKGSSAALLRSLCAVPCVACDAEKFSEISLDPRGRLSGFPFQNVFQNVSESGSEVSEWASEVSESGSEVSESGSSVWTSSVSYLYYSRSYCLVSLSLVESCYAPMYNQSVARARSSRC